MSNRLLAACALSLGALLAACAPVDGPGPVLPIAPSSAFNAADFAWSASPGQASIHGQVQYRQNSRAYACTGSVGLTPETPYTRARFQTLYGSTEGAALPEAVVRARNAADPGSDYRAFTRSEGCTNGAFNFTGLPDGGWFVIVRVGAEGAEPTVLMRHVVTRGGRAVAIVL
jgi:hypothetical protein